MELAITVHEEEKQAVINAITSITAIKHKTYMSQADIANCSGIKATKVRHVLAALLEEGRIVRYTVTQNPKLQRSFYVVTGT